MADIRAIQLGKQPMGDLDEGDAGIFEGRVFPHTERVGEKLEGYDARSRHVLLAALLPRVLADLERY